MHVTVNCDSVTVVDIGRGTTSSSSSTSLFSLTVLGIARGITSSSSSISLFSLILFFLG